MPKLPKPKVRLHDRIYRNYEQDRDDWRRPHLGASLIGGGCDRELFYVFRWAKRPDFDGRMLRLFRRGDFEEPWLAEDLRKTGIDVETIDPDTGDQWRFAWHGGHFGGSCDGLIRAGVHEAPKAMHVWECKTAAENPYRELAAKGVAKTQPKHAAQMEVYAYGFRERGLPVKRALYTAVCKNDDRIHAERVKVEDDSVAESHIERARKIIFAGFAPTPVSSNDEHPACRWCNFKSVCHERELGDLERNCRTCISSTPNPDGSWTCELDEIELNGAAQRAGCGRHLMRPDLVGEKPVRSSIANHSITYEINGERVVDRNREFSTTK